MKSQSRYDDLKKLYIDIADFPEKDKIVLSYVAHGLGEQNLFQFLNFDSKLRYLMQSDKFGKMRINQTYRAFDMLELPKFKKYKEVENFSQNLMQLSDNFKKHLSKLEEVHKAEPESVAQESIQQQQAAIEYLNKLQDEVSTFNEEAIALKKEEANILHKDFDIPKLNIPEVESRVVMLDPHAYEALLSENVNVVSLARDGLKMTMQSLFAKYMPNLLTTFDAIQNFMNKDKTRRLDFANQIHVQQFGDTVLFGMIGNKNSIYQFLKREGLSADAISDLSRYIQKEFLFIKDGKYYVNSVSVVKKNLSILFEQKEMRNLTEDEEFMKQIAEYQEKVMIPLVQSMREMQEFMGFDFVKAYQNVDFSIVNDMFSAMKGDPQVALKLSGINSEADFLAQLQANADKMGLRITNFVKKSMRDVVFKQKPEWYEKIIGALQTLHYNMTYGTLATLLHKTNIVSGFAQVLPNWTELRAYMSGNMEEASKVLELMDKYNIMQMEDQLKFGTGHGKNLRPGWSEKYIGALTKG